MSGEPLRLVLGTADLTDDDLTCRLLDQFYDAGGRAIDLANVYGDGAAERGVGRWLRTRGRRDDVVLYAKGCHPPSCDPRLVSDEVDTALRNLGADRLDVFLLHRDDEAIPVHAWAKAVTAELQRGTIERVGVSNWTVERFRALREQLAAAGENCVTTFSSHFSLARMAEPPWPGCLAIEADAARDLVNSGITLLAWASLAGGFLSDRSGRDSTARRSWGTPQNEGRRARAARLAAALGATTATIAVAYVLAHDGIRPVVGTRSAAHLEEALAAERIDLSPEQVADLETGAPA
jgi:aryl-alcohol dehydrogenase-like predicted oxidoreductase